jgi:hypothetical protein
MKKLLIFFLLLPLILALQAGTKTAKKRPVNKTKVPCNNARVQPNPQETWPSVNPEQVEREKIMLQIARINEQFTAMGGFRSSAREGAIVRYLKSLGTPLSYKIYQEMKASGQLSQYA